jgi:uncharacterized circularly permuted ATP-grasp superfamily protein
MRARTLRFVRRGFTAPKRHGNDPDPPLGYINSVERELHYVQTNSFDELIDADGHPRPISEPLWTYLSELGIAALRARQSEADEEVKSVGLTFRTYDEDSSTDRPWPFDIVPRIFGADEGARIEAGLVQRLVALNHFIDDAYHDQLIVRGGVVPHELVGGSTNFRSECVGVDVAGRIWAHICGSDLVRAEDGTLLLLEDNLRVPSGISYALENRMVAKHVFPEIFRSYSVQPIDQYVGRLAELLASVAPIESNPRIVLLTPGMHNAAYFEHAFLAQQLGVDLVEGGDVVVTDDDTVYVKTIDGLERVDVIYRRVDDLFLDPEVFRRDSLVGTPGLMRAWSAGNVAIVNAPGTAIADDKGVYPLVPAMIRFYLDQEPILANVPTWRCADEAARKYVLANLEGLVIKPANESGGYGIVMGPTAGREALVHVARRIEQHPPGWVAQPMLNLSTMPTMVNGMLVPRHVDLRPFTLLGPGSSYVTPGGLTRVARPEGSLIVNSSQGGGSKDTWVADGPVAIAESSQPAEIAQPTTASLGVASSETDLRPSRAGLEMAQ